MTSLLSLPDELLRDLSFVVGPETLVDFACVNKRILHCASNALERHAEWSALRVVHDRNPLNVISTLRKVARDPLSALHIRTVDFWGLREGFDAWKTYGWLPTDLDDERGYPPTLGKERHDCSNLSSQYFGKDELRTYRNVFGKVLHLDEDEISKWMDKIEAGFEEPLKVLLLALSPRLSKVVYLDYFAYPRNSYPLTLLSTSLRSLKASAIPPPQWPCFQSLKSIFVRHHTDFVTNHTRWSPMISDVASLLLLPKLETLNVDMLVEEDTVGKLYPASARAAVGPYLWEWDPYISPCRNLRIGTHFLASESMASVLGGIQQLEYLNFCVGIPGGTNLINAVLEHTKDSLQTLKLTHAIPPNEPGLWHPHNFRNFKVLRHLHITDMLLLDPEMYEEDVPGQGLQPRRRIGNGAPLSVPILDYVDLSSCLPLTIETLRVGSRARHGGPRPGELNTVLRRLCVLVELKAASQFPDLRAICVALLSRHVLEGSILGELHQLCDAKSITLHTAGFHGCELCNDDPGTVLESLPNNITQNGLMM